MSENLAGQQELMALVYRSLVRDTLLPSEPVVVGRAAMEAIATLADGGEALANGAATLPSWFGHDVGRDAAWLASRLPVDEPPWSVLAAMATAADKPHTNVAHESVMEGVGAVWRGTPPTSPGLGMWRQADGSLVVARVDEGGSAQACGLCPGDRVVAIDGKPPRPSGLHAIALHAAAEDSSLALQVERAGETRSIDLVFRPGAVVSATKRLLPGPVGYVGIPWFATSDDESRDTAALVHAVLTEFLGAGAAGVIIDLRSGTGGSLRAVRSILSSMSSAENVLALSEPEGESVVYARTGERVWPDRRIAVLVNEQSTSAAETLALGLEELADAALVGAATSGGLNTLRLVDLADGYKLVLPDQVVVGPRTLVGRPGYRLEPTVAVPNPTAADIRAGVDAQLEAARSWALGA